MPAGDLSRAIRACVLLFRGSEFESFAAGRPALTATAAERWAIHALCSEKVQFAFSSLYGGSLHPQHFVFILGALPTLSKRSAGFMVPP